MLNAADYTLLTILAVSMGIGLWRGFIVEVLSLTVWVAAFWLTIGFGSTVSDWFGGVSSPSARLFLGHAGVFLAVLLAGGAVTWAIGRLIAETGLSATDRVLGLGFGLARGLVLACVGVLLLGFTPMPQDSWWQASRLLPSAQRGAEWMVEFLPPAAAQHVSFASTPPVDVLATPEAGGPITAPDGDSPGPQADPVSATASDAAATPVPET